MSQSRIKRMACSLLFLCGASATSQTVISPSQLLDRTPETPGLIVGKAITAPSVPRGTVLFDCGSAAAPFVYGVGKPAACLAAQAQAIADPWALRASSAPIVRTEPHKFKSAVIPTGLTIADETGRVSSFVVNRYPAGAANGLTIERVAVVCGDSCIHISRDNAGVTIRDASFTAAAVDTKDGYEAGVKLDGTAHDVLIERVVSTGWLSTVPKGYPNRDGFADEAGNYRITYRYTRAIGATDGCYDLKSRDTLLDHASAANCNYGFRLRTNVRATALYATGTMKAALQLGPAADVMIDNLVLDGLTVREADIVGNKGGAPRITIARCSRPVTVQLVKAAVVTLGASCKRP